jgi:peroxiredoxin Q/BCP
MAAKSKELAVGDKAPDFTMPTDGKGKVSLAKLKGKKVVLYFYPKDETPGCTTEACGFRDSLPDFSKVDATVIGVSRDSVASHDKFKAKHSLPFKLASDEDGKTSDAYDTWGEKSMYGPEIHGHGARHVSHRRQGRDPRHLAQGQGERPCRERAEGGEGDLTLGSPPFRCVNRLDIQP